MKIFKKQILVIIFWQFFSTICFYISGRYVSSNMSINFSQNPEYIKDAQGNFGAGIPTPEPPHQYSMLKEMGIPTNGDEFVKWLPYFIPAVGASKGISYLATIATRSNPNNPSLTALESFNNSAVSRMSGRIDRFVSPITTRYASQINSTKSFFSRITPQWVKDLGQKVYRGVTPRNHMALSQYKGMTVMQLENFLGKIKELPPEFITRHNLKNVLELAAKNPKQAATSAINILEKLPAKELKALTSAKGKSLGLLEELTKSKAFLGMSGKTALGRGAQRGFMMVSEAAGGGVVGASWFGMIMNSIFLASTFKRTWNAPWGEKLSTFMEGALVDFCGGYLMALLGAKITYKLLGLKNADKTLAQLDGIEKLTNEIKQQREIYKLQAKAIKEAEKAGTSTLVRKVIQNGKEVETVINLADAKRYLSDSAFNINSAIEKLRKMKGFQKATGKGSFFKNLLHRPLRWMGNFLSVGLENLPENVVGKTIKNGKTKNISAFRVGWQHFKNSFKTIAGYPIRFGLVLMIVTPPLTKLCAKISHTLFGKPTKSIMDDREGKSGEQNIKTAGKNPYQVDMDTFNKYTQAVGVAKEMIEAQQDPIGYQRRKNAPAAQISPKLIQDAINAKKHLSASVRDEASYIPSSKAAFSTNGISDISPARYIPSTVGMIKTKSPMSDEVNAKALKADKLARYADRELAASKQKSFDF